VLPPNQALKRTADNRLIRLGTVDGGRSAPTRSRYKTASDTYAMVETELSRVTLAAVDGPMPAVVCRSKAPGAYAGTLALIEAFGLTRPSGLWEDGAQRALLTRCCSGLCWHATAERRASGRGHVG
jgi:hypothetical protein